MQCQQQGFRCSGRTVDVQVVVAVQQYSHRLRQRTAARGCTSMLHEVELQTQLLRLDSLQNWPHCGQSDSWYCGQSDSWFFGITAAVASSFC